MSQRAITWALEQKDLTPAPWIVLVKLADRHNKDTLQVNPSQIRLAHDCNMSRATLNRHLSDLEEMGLIRRVRRMNPDTMQQMTTFYILGLDFDNPPDVDCAVSNIETRDSDTAVVENAGEKPVDNEGRVSNLDTEPVSQKSTIPCLNSDDSRVSNRDTNQVNKTKKRTLARDTHAGTHDEAGEIAEKWVQAVKERRGYAASCISLPLARKMLALGLVTKDELRACGIAH